MSQTAGHADGEHVPDPLPAGPRMPAIVQTIAYWTRPTAFLERMRAHHGSRFTLRLLGLEPIVIISAAEEVREILLAPPEVLHPGEGGKIIEPLVGPTSVIVLDEQAHMEQRKLMLPPFHGKALASLSGLIGEFAEREVSSWPTSEPVALHPRLQRVTLEIILRVVFGLGRGSQLDALREVLTRILAFGDNPLAMLWTLPGVTSVGPGARQTRLLEEADRLIFALVEERRAETSPGDDVLSLLLAARHDDGSQMTDRELRDELVTALAAGHETTASQLAWAFTLLSQAPELTARLQREVDSEDEQELLSATIHEVMRMRPVLPNAEPRVVKKPTRIGDRTYPVGTTLYASTYLMHHDPSVYPEPYRFRPERFLESPPGTYTWIPFGGGRRRCVGASFAMLEMHAVLRAALARYDIHPVTARAERARRRGIITISPMRGATVVLESRVRSRRTPLPELQTATAP